MKNPPQTALYCRSTLSILILYSSNRVLRFDGNDLVRIAIFHTKNAVLTLSSLVLPTCITLKSTHAKFMVPEIMIHGIFDKIHL